MLYKQAKQYVKMDGFPYWTEGVKHIHRLKP